MPIYAYRCPDCNTTLEDFRFLSRRDELPECDKCGTPMLRDISAECRGIRSPNFHKPIEMFSIAPNTPEEVKELRDAGATFTPELVPLAHNRTEKKRLMKVAGVVEMS